MTTADELVFTGEQLTLLAGMAGEPRFPYAGEPDLSDSGWNAVARGLLARGVLGDDLEMAGDRALDAVLGIVLFADSALRLTIVYAEGEGDSRHEIVWLKGDALVRQTVWPSGIHHFAGGERGSLDELLAAVLTFPSAGESAAGDAQTVSEQEYGDAVALLRDEGIEAAGLRHPGLAGHLEALASARRLTSAGSRSRGEDRVEGEELTLVESHERGLWLVRQDAAAASVVLQPIAPVLARERVAALADCG